MISKDKLLLLLYLFFFKYSFFIFDLNFCSLLLINLSSYLIKFSISLIIKSKFSCIKLKLRNKFTKKIINKLSNTINLLAEYDKYIYSNLEIQKGGDPIQDIDGVIKAINDQLDTITSDNILLINKTNKLFNNYKKILEARNNEIEAKVADIITKEAQINNLQIHTIDLTQHKELENELNSLKIELKRLENKKESLEKYLTNTNVQLNEILKKLNSGIKLEDLIKLVNDEYTRLNSSQQP